MYDIYHNSLKFFPTHKQSKSQATNFKILFISFSFFSSKENLHVKFDIILMIKFDCYVCILCKDSYMNAMQLEIRQILRNKYLHIIRHGKKTKMTLTISNISKYHFLPTRTNINCILFCCTQQI